MGKNKYGPRSENMKTKEKTSSARGNQAVLERLDAALARHAGPQLSDREKLDRLRRRLFGDAAVDAANASSREAEKGYEQNH
jgi:hypothetical protein